MGFRPSKADFDLWMKKQGDHYEYVATYVDDVLVFSKDPMTILDEIKMVFDLKGVGKPEYYLGGNFHSVSKTQLPGVLETENDLPDHHLTPKWKKEDITMAFSAKTYIKILFERLKTVLGSVLSQFKSPMVESLHPELEDSPILKKEEHS